MRPTPVFPVLGLFLVFAAPLPAQAAAPPSTPAVHAALQAHAESMAAAQARLREGFAAARACATESLQTVPAGLSGEESLSLLEQLQAEEDAFVRDPDRLPRHVLVRSALAAYVAERHAAQQALVVALTREVERLSVAAEPHRRSAAGGRPDGAAAAAAVPAPAKRVAQRDRVLASLPVGSVVKGLRTEPKAVSGTVEATMDGTVIRHDARWLVIRAQERWGRASPVWDWRFERDGNDPRTGKPRWVVRAGQAVKGEVSGHRSNWRGHLVLDGERLVGRYGFDWRGMERKGNRAGTDELTHPLVLAITLPEATR